ncbi:MAG: MarR family transcriptional regulator [Clostridia bacterium]|nr:MarR family transcriptional regulator [Clostridia bacterium]
MEKETFTALQKGDKNEEYLFKVFGILKARESFVISSEKTHFNKTELRLISEVLAASYENRRLFSTQIAKILGVTRSAVSHTVNRLEARGVVKRIPSNTDKKVEYIEISEDILKTYKEDIQKCVRFVGEVVEEFGEDDFYKMCELYEKFVNMAQAKLKD